MKENKKLAYIVLSLIIILFNVIVFVLPMEKSSTFWVGYGFSIIALLAQIPIWKLGNSNENMKKNSTVGFSIIGLGVTYSIAQLIAFTIFMMIPRLETWISILVSTLIFGIFLVLLISTKIAANEINRVEKKVKNKTSYIKELQFNIEKLISKEENDEFKEKLKELLEKIRFSDPMSNELISEIENQILEKVNNLKDIKNDKNEIIKDITLLIDERNQKCKILK